MTARIDAARPTPWTFDPRHTAVLMIDMQRDFLEPGGFGAALGNDVSRLQPAIMGAASLLAAARAGGWAIFHNPGMSPSRPQ